MTTTADYTRCLQMLRAAGALDHEITCLTIDGEPRSKARPRFSGNGHVYTASKQRESEKILGLRLRHAMKKVMPANVAVACLFYRSTSGRVDTDNMLKHVMDAANGICWADDYQVTAMVGITELDRDRPRTVIGVAHHESSMVRSGIRSRECEQCGGVFEILPSAKTRFCSPACAGKSFAKIAAPVPCAQCDEPFRRGTSTQRFCSKSCRCRWQMGSPRGKGLPALCQDCGELVKRKASPRCRACWKKSVRAASITPPAHPKAVA